MSSSTTKYTSLEQIRADKLRVRSMIDSDVHRLQTSLSDCFMPTNKGFLRSPSKYMNYIGYGIIAYKTASTFMGVVKFVRKLFLR